jgi:hypothetical protein
MPEMSLGLSAVVVVGLAVIIAWASQLAVQTLYNTLISPLGTMLWYMAGPLIYVITRRRGTAFLAQTLNIGAYILFSGLSLSGLSPSFFLTLPLVGVAMEGVFAISGAIFRSVIVFSASWNLTDLIFWYRGLGGALLAGLVVFRIGRVLKRI